MDYYGKVINSLSISFSQADKYILRQPICINDYHSEDNTLILLHSGNMSFGYEDDAIKAGELFFIPAGTKVSMTYGEAANSQNISQEDFNLKQENYLVKWTPKSRTRTKTYFSKIKFSAKAFDIINFVEALEIPSFIITNHFIISNLVNQLFSETIENRVGAKRLISVYTEQIMIEVMRYLLDNKLFIEIFATNQTHFEDIRLAKIFKHIREDSKGELSNTSLAEAADVSDKYLGQYFKGLTGMKPQDFVEYKRMQRAVGLLKSTKMSIDFISKGVGYNDTAYFCRRFKTMYGIPPGKLRQRHNEEKEKEMK
jgi:YesN/AraC family two-component response regulator